MRFSILILGFKGLKDRAVKKDANFKTKYVKGVPFFNRRIPFLSKVVYQGHATTVFCKISWERLRISRWPFHSCTIFEDYLIKSLPYLLILIFRISLPRLSYFSQKKETWNFRTWKCNGKRNQKDSHFRRTLNCI